MADHLFSSIVTIATAIVGVAILAVLVSKQANTSGVIQAATGGFAQDLAAAVAPVSGGFGSFTGGGVSPLNFQ
jgi:hypothetical protein